MDLDALVERAVVSGSPLSRTDLRELIEFVVELGASDDELRAAIGTHNLGDLAVDLSLRRGARHSFAEIAAAADLTPADAARYWRALGFADPLESGVRLTDDAAAALRIFVMGRDLLGEEATLALARVVGTSTARIAEALLTSSRSQLEAPQLASGRSYPTVVRAYTELARAILPPFADAVGTLLIRHLVEFASTPWSADAEGGGVRQDLAIGFADITGYTALSRTLTGRELTQLIGSFEEVVSDAVSQHGGRIVKLLGDGALLSSDDARRACQIAAAIVAASASDPALPSIRVGLAAGTVINHGGDLYGPVVNLAARLVAVAPERAVVVDEEVRARAAGDAFVFERLPPQELKGAGAPVAFRLVS